ncbi:hypothetical protein ABMA27_012315 [Loxostege sticticalis]|uniref:THAP-type domain-containing protein n=1 Tax=Loxostege sticticalis TaxID=481309 RepID=A0ABR3H0V1_LOXSC
MPSCVVKSCKNYMSKLKKTQGITYHRGENNWNPSPASTVCSTHFDDIDFMTSAKGRRCLVPHAIPKRVSFILSLKIESAPPSHSVQLRRLNYTLHKKSLMIDLQKKKIKTLNQKIRRFRNRNESLKNILKNLRNLKGRKETIFISFFKRNYFFTTSMKCF